MDKKLLYVGERAAGYTGGVRIRACRRCRWTHPIRLFPGTSSICTRCLPEDDPQRKGLLAEAARRRKRQAQANGGRFITEAEQFAVMLEASHEVVSDATAEVLAELDSKPLPPKQDEKTDALSGYMEL